MTSAETPSEEMLAGLSRALRRADGLPLVALPRRVGLFPATSTGRRLAAQARDAGLLAACGTSNEGKKPIELFTLTAAGRRLLEEAADPTPVLQQLVAAVQDRQTQLGALQAELAVCRRELAAVAQRVESILPKVMISRGALAGAAGCMARDRREEWARDRERSPMAVRSASDAAEPLAEGLLVLLRRWNDERPSADCPLAELFRGLRTEQPSLSVGAFHDALRRLHASGVLRLQPWTGPLAELPEPELALLAGHAVMAYAAAC